MASTTTTSAPSSHHHRVVEKPNQELLQQQQEALKCPRCDSSNTKFCYYNNYSLSQPRHFCKACKRYWTRGGTLRNVPVGGGCRKNKRIMRRPNNSATSSSASEIYNTSSSNPSSSTTVSATTISNSTSQSHHQIDVVASNSNYINPLFFGMNLPFPRFNSSSGFDHNTRLQQPYLMDNNSIGGLNFTDNIVGYRNGLSSNHHHTLLSGYNYNSSSIFVNSSSSSTSITTSSTAPPPTTTTIMASLLSSTDLQQQKFINNSGGAINDNSTFQGGMVSLKEVKSVVVEDDDNYRFLSWQDNNQIEQHQEFLLSDQTSSLYWNTAATTMVTNAWNDQTNTGSHHSLLSSDLQ